MPHTQSDTQLAYFKIQLILPTVVETVLIINRADCCSDRIKGSDLWVGNSDTSLEACLAYPQGDGIYSCGGKVGKIISLKKTQLGVLNIGEIRAYSLKPHSINDIPSLLNFTNSGWDSNCNTTNSIFDWPKSANLPVLSIHATTACVQGISQKPSVWYQILFPTPRFVHAITILAHSSNDYANSKDWKLRCDDGTNLEDCGMYIDPNDKYGKEVTISKKLKELKIESTTNKAMKFFWIGLFTTETDCSGSTEKFDWSYSRKDWPVIKVEDSTSVEGLIEAKLGDCPVAHAILSPTDLSYVIYNKENKKLTINQPPAEGRLDITIESYSNYGGPYGYNQQKLLSLPLRRCDYSLTPPIKNLSFEKTDLDQFADLSPVTSTASVNYIPNFSLEPVKNSAGINVNFFTLEGQTCKIDKNVEKGIYNLKFTEFDSQCQQNIMIYWEVTIYDCTPIGLGISPNTLQIELNDQQKELSWSSNQLDAACGDYSFTTESNPQVWTDRNVIFVQPWSEIGTKTFNFLLTRNSNPRQTASAQLTVTTFDCKPSGLKLTSANLIVQYQSTLLNVITWSQDQKNSNCGTYQIDIGSNYASLFLIDDANRMIKSTFNKVVGEYEIPITLVSFTNIEKTTTANLKVTVYCPIDFKTKTAIVTEVKVGIDIQPVRLAFDVDYLSCKAAAIFSLSIQEPFLSLDVITTSSGFIKILNATRMMHKVYTCQLTATNSYQTVSKDVQITINGCPSTTIQRQAIKSVEIFRLAGQQNGYFQLTEFKHSLAQLLAVDCGKFVQKLTLASGVASPAWITLDQSIIKYDISSIEKAQTFELNLNVSLKDYPNVEINERFNITVASSDIACNQFSPIDYYIYDPPVIIAPSYLNQTYAIMTRLTKVIKPIINREGEQQVDPDFIKYENGQFTVQSNKMNDLGSYEVGISVGYLEFPAKAVQCKVPLTVKYIPQFKGEKIETQKVICTDQWSFRLPNYTDKEGQAVQVAIDLGQASQFLEYDEKTKILRSDPKEIEGIVQNYKIEMTLTDMYANTITRSFKLDINCTVKVIQPFIPEIKLKVPLVPVIIKISNQGLMRVEFSKPIILPTFSVFPELKTQFNCTDSCARQLQRNKTADMLESIQIVNQAQVQVNGTSLPIVDINILPGLYSNQTQLAFNWQCVDFQPTHMDIQLNFNYSEMVSVYTERDQIKLNFIGNQYFRSADGETISPDKTIATRSIVPQMSPEVAQKLEIFADTVKQTSKAIIMLNFILKLFISQSLNTLFGAMNKLQIIAHLLLIHVPISSNAWSFFASLMSLVNFDIIDTEPMSRKIFRFQTDSAQSDTFEELGYGSRFFIINMGTLLYAFFGFLVALALIPLLGKFNHARVQYLKAKLVQKLVWATFIEYFTESYLSTAVSCFISFHYWTLRPFGEFFSQSLACAFLIILITVPIFKLVYLWRNQHLLRTPAFEAKYQSAYENLRFRLQRWALLEPFMTDCRRLTLAIAIVYSQSYPILQLAVTYYQILIVTVFNGQIEPFATKSMGRLEQFNELVVSVIFYHMLCFSDLVRDQTVRMQIGWSMIACTSTCFLINFSIVIYQLIMSVINRIKLWSKQKKMKLEAQRRQRIDKERQKQMLIYYEEQKREEQQQQQVEVLEAKMTRTLPWFDRPNQEFMEKHVIPVLAAINQNDSLLIIDSDRPIIKSHTLDERNIKNQKRVQIGHIQQNDITPDQRSNEVSPRTRWEQRSSFFRTEN